MIKLPLSREDLQEKITALSLEDMEILLGWLKLTVKEQKKAQTIAQIPLKKGRELVETLHTSTTLYRLEKVKCGKKKCKCNKGQLHGPYWYAYQWNGKKMTSTYIGKTLAPEMLTNGTKDTNKLENQTNHGPENLLQ